LFQSLPVSDLALPEN
jgi:HNH endonuclease